jgi:DUF1680 family protein
MSTVGGQVTYRSREMPLLGAAVPYFAWNNRGLGSMAVWLPDGA